MWKKTIWYRIVLALLCSFALLLLLLLSWYSYVEAAPPPGGVSPTPPPNVTSTLVNLSATKESLSPADATPIADMPTALPAPADMPTALPAPPATVTPDNSLLSSPLDVDITIMASDETSDALAANSQDDEWRANAAAQGFSFCLRGTLSDSDSNSADINQILFADGQNVRSISYSLREINEELIGYAISEGEDAQGRIHNEAFMKSTAPIPQELLDLGPEAAFEEQVGSTNYANGLLFTFGEPGVQAFGAWFGGLASRAPLEGVGIDGDPRGGKLAYMRLFDDKGRQIGPDRAIRPAQKEEQALCLDMDGSTIDCAAAHTRWIGFVASEPIAQMLLVVGDDDDSDQRSACRVEADDGSEAEFIAQCQAGDEHLSFVGPTICSEALLKKTPIVTHPTSNNRAPSPLQPTRNDAVPSLALTATGISLLGLLGWLWWRKRR